MSKALFFNEGENIVANLSLYNPINATSNIEANIDVALEKPILKRCNDYKLTIVRFRIPLSNIVPSFDLNGNFFRILMTYNNNTYGAQTTITNFFPKSLYEVINLVNGLLAVAYNQLATNNPVFNSVTIPFMFYNPETDLCYLVLPYTFFANYVIISFSQDLYYYFAGFPAAAVSSFAGYYDILLENVENNYYFSKRFDLVGAPVFSSSSGLTKVNAMLIPEEFPTSYRFNDVQKIILASNIPVRHEFLPLNSGNSNIIPGTTSNPLSYINTLPVLNDFSVNVTRFGEQTQPLIYIPQGQFRWIDMQSDAPLDRLSFRFYYQKENQDIAPIMLSPGDSADIKVYFVRKSVS
jgi:hypothetical protein